MRIDLLIHSATQLITCASNGKPKRGKMMADVGFVRDGALAIDNGQIIAVGSTSELQAQYSASETLNASGKTVCPGLIDPHTHVVYAGDRVGEFEMRIQGATYMDIMAAGGGIVNTMQAIRASTVDQLAAESRERLDTMLTLGTTTAEVKTGYGLDTASELKMLQAIEILTESHPVDLVPTFLGAHAVPPEYKGRTDAYVEMVINEMLPAVMDWYRASTYAPRAIPLFIDVFCEDGVFDVAQSRRILEAGQRYGLPIKAHVDEFKSLGGVTMGVELGAVSVDHLDTTGADEIARLAASDTVAVPLPAVNFNLGSTHFADARALLDAGAILALATDINPGSAPCPSMPLVMAMACRYQHLLPAEALNASTINAAYAIGLGDKIGSLEVGKDADVLILNTPDYRHLAYEFGGNLVGRVIKWGTMIGR